MRGRGRPRVAARGRGWGGWRPARPSSHTFCTGHIRQITIYPLDTTTAECAKTAPGVGVTGGSPGRGREGRPRRPKGRPRRPRGDRAARRGVRGACRGVRGARGGRGRARSGRRARRGVLGARRGVQAARRGGRGGRRAAGRAWAPRGARWPLQSGPGRSRRHLRARPAHRARVPPLTPPRSGSRGQEVERPYTAGWSSLSSQCQIPVTFAPESLMRSNFAATAGSAPSRSAAYRDRVCSRTMAMA
jgi:hypothetical protein